MYWKIKDPRVVVALVAVMGLILSLVGLYQIGSSLDTFSWEQGRGEIISSKFSKKVSRRGRSARRTTTYYADVTYSFSANGHRYRGARLDMRDPAPDSPLYYTKGGYNSEASAKAVLKTYPKGKRVEVWYDPKDPKNHNVLDPSVNKLSIINTFVGMVVFAGALFAFLMLSRGSAPALAQSPPASYGRAGGGGATGGDGLDYGTPEA